MTIFEEADEISKWPQPIRLAEYLKVLAENTVIGARLRTSKQDEEWTEEDKQLWESSCEKMEPYWYALSENDRKVLRVVMELTGSLCRGENLY